MIMPTFRDAAWGFIVGDALGVPYEFSDRNFMKLHPAKEMTGFGTFNQPPGTWSDDTTMMLCVLENILNEGDSADLELLFLKWYNDGYRTAHGEVFDIGITTRSALINLNKTGKSYLNISSNQYSAGNGSLMRCLPYAFLEDFSESVFRMMKDNRITHRNSLCDLCCLFYVRMVRCILEGDCKNSALEKSISYLKHGWRITDHDARNMLEIMKFKRICNNSFRLLPESDIQSTGYVLSTLEAVIWCFINSDNYKDAILKAVNLGGDTDTIAALTGGLAGLYYGISDIPQEWLDCISNKQTINELLNSINHDGQFI